MAFSSRRNFVCCISHLRSPGSQLVSLQVFTAQGCGRSSAHVSVEEGDYLRVRVEPVLQLGEAMALVLVQEVIDRTAVAPHALYDLLGLSDGHARVVLAVDDH